MQFLEVTIVRVDDVNGQPLFAWRTADGNQGSAASADDCVKAAHFVASQQLRNEADVLYARARALEHLAVLALAMRPFVGTADEVPL